MSDDSFTRGFYDIPSDEKLRGMNYVDLAALLASTEKDSAKYLVVEREKARRDTLEIASLQPKVIREKGGNGLAQQNTYEEWYKKPPGTIVIGAAATLLATAVLWVIHHYLTS